LHLHGLGGDGAWPLLGGKAIERRARLLDGVTAALLALALTLFLLLGKLGLECELRVDMSDDKSGSALSEQKKKNTYAPFSPSAAATYALLVDNVGTLAQQAARRR